MQMMSVLWCRRWWCWWWWCRRWWRCWWARSGDAWLPRVAIRSARLSGSYHLLGGALASTAKCITLCDASTAKCITEWYKRWKCIHCKIYYSMICMLQTPQVLQNASNYKLNAARNAPQYVHCILQYASHLYHAKCMQYRMYYIYVHYKINHALLRYANQAKCLSWASI